VTRASRQDGLFEPNVFLQFFLAAQPVGRLVERAIRKSGMSASDYAILSAIDELEPVTPADVARLTGMPRPTLSATIERLSRAGHLRRRKNPRDGRSYTLALSARGRRAKAENGAALLEAEKQLAGTLSHPEQVKAQLAELRVAAEAALEEAAG
jgi:DNA-binding MarR family transcriptional regulator